MGNVDANGARPLIWNALTGQSAVIVWLSWG